MTRSVSTTSALLNRTLWLWLAFWLCGTLNATAQTVPPPPIATAAQSFGFDYKDADLTSAVVVRFEMQVDATPPVSVQIPPKANDAQTPAGSSTYKVPIPALVTGAHTVAFRACNAQVCGVYGPSLAFVLTVQPPPPSVPRILGN